VDLTDFTILAANFNKSLPAPAADAAAPPEAAPLSAAPLSAPAVESPMPAPSVTDVFADTPIRHDDLADELLGNI